MAHHSLADPEEKRARVLETDSVQGLDNTVLHADVGIAAGSWGLLTGAANNTQISRKVVNGANVGIALRAVASSRYWIANVSVSTSNVVNNHVGDSGEESDDIGIQVAGTDASANYNTTVSNYKGINNDIIGFNEMISDDGSATKVAANDPYATEIEGLADFI